MGNTRQVLEPDCDYHIYNHAINNEKLFREGKNYDFFLTKISKYIMPMAEIVSYCLMSNHFHLLVHIKDETVLMNYFQEKLLAKKIVHEYKTTAPNENQRTSEKLEDLITQQFAHCFNSYSKAFNKAYSREGQLMKKSFHRKKVRNDTYLRNLICYINNNPVCHGFVKTPESWKYSSHNDILENKTEIINQTRVKNIVRSIEEYLDLIHSATTTGRQSSF